MPDMGNMDMSALEGMMALVCQILEIWIFAKCLVVALKVRLVHLPLKRRTKNDVTSGLFPEVTVWRTG